MRPHSVNGKTGTTALQNVVWGWREKDSKLESEEKNLKKQRPKKYGRPNFRCLLETIPTETILCMIRSVYSVWLPGRGRPSNQYFVMYENKASMMSGKSPERCRSLLKNEACVSLLSSSSLCLSIELTNTIDRNI
jgi:hypothetical protein